MNTLQRRILKECAEHFADHGLNKEADQLMELAGGGAMGRAGPELQLIVEASGMFINIVASGLNAALYQRKIDELRRKRDERLD